MSYQILTASLGTLVLSLFTYYSYKIYRLRKKYEHIPGPPANGIIGFYLGNLFDYVKTLYNSKLANDLVLEWIKKYGKTIKVQVVFKMIVYTIDTTAIREGLIERNFPKYKFIYEMLGYPYNIRFIGDGLVTDANNLRWKNKRIFYNQAFHKKVLASFINDFNSKSDLLLEKLRKSADSKNCVNMLNEFCCTALDIISRVAFGMETDSLNDPKNKLNSFITESLAGVMRFMHYKPIIFSSILPNEILYKYKYKKIIKELREIGREQILSRIKLIQVDEYVPSDLLSITLKSAEKTNSNDMEDMIDDFLTFFIAGQETTANTLTFCILELAQNPHVFIKLREEIDTVLGSRNEITEEDLNKLVYTSCVIKEALRKWPPVEGSGRIVDIDDFRIENYSIPKDTYLHFAPLLAGRYDEYFENPIEFMPERFIDYRNKVNPYAYFPFSLGPRNCIGQNFAKMEMKMVLAKLVQNFDFKLVENQNLNIVQLSTLRPIDGAKCFISSR